MELDDLLSHSHYESAAAALAGDLATSDGAALAAEELLACVHVPEDAER